MKALCRKQSTELQTLGVETVCADLSDRDSVLGACRSVEVVIHAAGITGLGGRWKDHYQINTLGTRWVIEGCRRHGVGRLVFTSSPSVIFDGNDQCGVDESAPYPRRWLCHYARSKAMAEQEVLAANGRDGLLTCALRPHLIWGPRDRSLVPRLWERAGAAGWCRWATVQIRSISLMWKTRLWRISRPPTRYNRVPRRQEKPISSLRASQLTAGLGSISFLPWPTCRRCEDPFPLAMPGNWGPVLKRLTGFSAYGPIRP